MILNALLLVQHVQVLLHHETPETILLTYHFYKRIHELTNVEVGTFYKALNVINAMIVVQNALGIKIATVYPVVVGSCFRMDIVLHHVAQELLQLMASE